MKKNWEVWVDGEPMGFVIAITRKQAMKLAEAYCQEHQAYWDEIWLRPMKQELQPA